MVRNSSSELGRSIWREVFDSNAARNEHNYNGREYTGTVEQTKRFSKTQYTICNRRALRFALCRQHNQTVVWQSSQVDIEGEDVPSRTIQ